MNKNEIASEGLKNPIQETNAIKEIRSVKKLNLNANEQKVIEGGIMVTSRIRRTRQSTDSKVCGTENSNRKNIVSRSFLRRLKKSAQSSDDN